MPSSKRKEILDALKTTLEGITVGMGYRSTVNTVEFSARMLDKIADSELPHISIIPGTETFNDSVGRVVSTWLVDLVVNDKHAKDLTGITGIEVLSNWTTDIRRALYADATLGLGGYCIVTLRTRQGSESHPDAADESKATMILGLEIKFEEDIDAA